MNAPMIFRLAPAASRPSFARSEGGRFVAALLGCLALLFPSLASAQLYTETVTLHNPAGDSSAFGLKVAAEGDTMVVSTSAAPPHGNFRAYVFVRGAAGWTVQQQMDFPTTDVAIDGETLVGGGVVYVRSGGAWTAQQTPVTLDHPRPALQGDTLVLGNPYDRTQSRGGVYVFTRSGSTWTQQAAFGPDGPATTEMMGDTVALDGDTFIAGVNGGTGGAYVFVRSGTTWTRQTRLVPPTGNGAGNSVALEGDTAAVSDPAGDKVYLFTRSGTAWTLAQTLTRPAGDGNSFGLQLSLKGGILGVGAGPMFYLYARTSSGWSLAQTIDRTGSPVQASLAVANDGKLFVVGNAAYVSSQGVVNIFSVPPAPAPGGGWKDADIGNVGYPGSSSGGGTDATVSGSGADIWNAADQFHFRSETLTGDGAIIARVTSAGTTNPWAKVGLMFREDVAPASRTVMALVTPGAHLGLQARTTTADTTSFTDAGWAAAPIWLMLSRTGDVFDAFRSDDGDHWSPIGSSTVKMPATIHVGLAVSSHDNAAVNTGTFSGIELVRAEPPPATELAAPSSLSASVVDGVNVRLQWLDNSTDEESFLIERSAGTGSGTFEVVATAAGTNLSTGNAEDENLAENSTYTYRVRAKRGSETSASSNTVTVNTTQPPPVALAGKDLGTVGVPGSYTDNNGVITIDASGTDIWEQADSGYFASRLVHGDFDVRARITSLGDTNPWAKVGIMAREWDSPGSANVFVLLTAGNVAGMQVRNSSFNSTTFTGGPWVRAPYWVRLVRAGSTFTSYISPDGATWQTIGSVSLAQLPDLAVGIAVTSHANSTTTRATIESLQFGN